MGRAFVGLVAVACLAGPGCSRNHYQLRITPAESGFRRELTCWKVVANDPPDRQPIDGQELARIEKAYGSPPEPGEEGKNTFRGEFSVETPQDIGGAGRLERLETSLGSLWVYTESFRGTKELEGTLAKRRQAVDTLVDLALEWLRKELGKEPGFARLERFVEQEVRSDLKNIAIYLWVRTSDPARDSNGDVLEWLWLYGRERDYVRLDDIARFARASHTEGSAPHLEIAARRIARELEIDPMSESLSVFRDPDRFSRSWDEHVLASEAFQQHLQQREESAEADDPPDAGDFVQHLLSEAFVVFAMEPDDHLEVRLETGVEPLATNGTWDEAEKSVVWSATMGSQESLPLFCHARWAVPDVRAQEKLFGRVLLSSERLGDYVVWRNSLSEREGAQWDSFLTAREPGEDVAKQLEGFRFDEATADQEALVEVVRGLFSEESGAESSPR